LPRFGIQSVRVLLLAVLAAPAGPAQNGAGPNPGSAKQEAVVTSVRVVHERGVPVVEVVSTHPVVPTLQMLDSPPRLVIDLPNAHMGLPRKRIPVLKENILTIRTEQYQIEPPVTRIVVDLLVPYGYSWDATGNRLTVRLKPPEDPNAASAKSPFQPPKVLTVTAAGEPAVVPVTSGIGDVVLAGKTFAAGSALTAGSETLVLRLTRGGEVRVCPGTTISLTPSKNSKDLMLGMSTGALETHSTLGVSADTVLTPDFRIVFAGPGEFHFAVSTDAHGNTCVRGLRGNKSSAMVSELLGDRMHQVKPGEQLVFHSGRLDKIDGDVPLECGCPQPAPVMRADAGPTLVPDSESATRLGQGNASPENAAKAANDLPADVAKSGTRQTLSSGPETQPLPASQPGEVHVQVDAPFVFPPRDHSAAPPAPISEAAALPVTESSARSVQLEAQVQPPPAQAATQTASAPRRFLRRVKGFFVAIFH
jgi:hypothetical protein